MFGLFKKSVSAHEFGQGATRLAGEFLFADALRSLGTRFGNFEDSNGWAPLLTKNGVSETAQQLYFHLYGHGVMQAAFTQFAGATRREMTQGAMSLFTKKPQSYDFEKTYQTLETAYSGRQRFDPKIEVLSNVGAQAQRLPNSNAAVLTAKYLIADFVVPPVPNNQNFFDDFSGYSSTVFSTIGTACRAIDQLSKSVEIS